jgi:hypothetical protein
MRKKKKNTTVEVLRTSAVGETLYVLVGYGGEGVVSSGRGVKPTTNLHLVPRLIMYGSTPPLPNASSRPDS